VSDQSEKAARLRALHHRDEPLLLPNPWDAGSAKLLASLGFQALATTSSGAAATLGRLDHRVTADEALAQAAAIVAATDLPVSADLESAFAHEPQGVAHTIEGAVEVGLAGCSVEDFSGEDDDPIYDRALAAERIAAAADVAHQGEFVLTARAENYLHGRRDLDDTIGRLQRYEQAGADVLYAPGLTDLDEIRTLVGSVNLPVNVLALRGAPSVPELAAVGVKRISVGGAFAFVALAAVVEAADEFLGHGTYGFSERAALGAKAARAAFSSR
jgi:2-methylisocitrate lyase-like PEP mutase family enzyme